LRLRALEGMQVSFAAVDEVVGTLAGSFLASLVLWLRLPFPVPKSHWVHSVVTTIFPTVPYDD
jgi:hypothetical protein